jgi:predicted transcriptional regulator
MGKVKEQQVAYAPKRKKSSVPKSRPKQLAADLVKGMKDSATFDDIIYQLYVLREIENGEEDIRAGRVLSHDEVKRMLGKWLK